VKFKKMSFAAPGQGCDTGGAAGDINQFRENQHEDQGSRCT
jgi:hypothetical protein